MSVPGDDAAGWRGNTRRACTGDLHRFLSRSTDRRLHAATELTDDERLADAMQQMFEQYRDLHVIVTEYVSALTDAGRAPATIERALAAIAAAHQAAGAGTLRTDGPRQVLRTAGTGPPLVTGCGSARPPRSPSPCCGA